MIPFVVPVLFSSAQQAVQTTTATLGSEGVVLRTLKLPRMLARVSMALYLPDGQGPEVVVGEVAEVHPAAPPEMPGFLANFVDLPPSSRQRIEAAVARAGGEHRSFSRHSVDLEVEVAGTGPAHAVDISSGGLFLRDGHAAGRGQALELRLDLHDGKGTADTRAVVVRAADDGRGMQFLDFGPSFRERLSMYLEAADREHAG
jgi:hypothetical protein